MKKILGIVGSPRSQGNTHVLIQQILSGATQAGAQTDIAHLGKLSIQECNGCHICWQNKPCVRQDDMNPLFEHLAQSQVLLLGTPVYWYGPTALMKSFLDRFVYFNCPENRPHIAGTQAVLVVPFEENDPDTAAPLLAMFEKSLDYLDMPLYETILVPGVTHRGEVSQNTEIMNRCTELGQKLALL